DRFLGLGPGLLHHAHILRVWLLGADFHEAASHLLEDELVAESLDRIEFAVMPRALQKLEHEDAHSLPDGSQRRPHGRGGLALAGAGIHDDETTVGIRHKPNQLLYADGNGRAIDAAGR